MTNRNDDFAPIDLVFPGVQPAVRPALKALITGLAPLELSPTLIGQIELALAEALNNIVEHAYTTDTKGSIRITCSRVDNLLEVAIIDGGAPLPNFELPQGDCANIETSFETLPEGGFGWFLILTMAQDVRYRRAESENHLTLDFAL